MPLALISMIEDFGKIMCYDMFMMCARERSTRGKHLDSQVLCDLNLASDFQDSVDGDMLLSAAMTYWVTQSSWLGETDPDRVTYALNTGDKNEQEEIRKRIRTAKKRIYQINQKMTRQHYIVENMDYVDLIKKYRDEYGEDIIFYLDPPYHVATLNKSNVVNGKANSAKISKPAPYEDSFLYEQTVAMTYLLATMKWFIKSDYDPYYFYRAPYIPANGINKHLPEAIYYHDFDLIENLENGFYREYLGSFHKGTNTGDDEGMEVIWSRYDGTEESLEWMQVTQDDVDFWNRKKRDRIVLDRVNAQLKRGKTISPLLGEIIDAVEKESDWYELPTI